MLKIPNLPEIPELERTPLVDALVALVESLFETARRQEEEIGKLKDEISVLKGEKARPVFKPSKLDEKTEAAGEESVGDGPQKRPGSNKRSKTQELVIHEERKIPPKDLPEGSRFKGYKDYVVQDIVVEARNIRYLLECWLTPEGKLVCGELPETVKGHYGEGLRALVLYLHHHGRVTQPLLLEMLREWGADLSAGQLDALLTQGHEDILREKDGILQAGLEVSAAVTVDDTGNRHQGKNGYTTHIGNALFAWFASTGHKNRLNFLGLLRAGETDREITGDALDYMKLQKLPQAIIAQLGGHPVKRFADETAWKAHLAALGIEKARHIRIASEAAQVGCLLKNELWEKLVVVSDDAGQFDVPLMQHALCWVHAERLVHKLVPLNDGHRQAQAGVRGQIWDFYKSLKGYAANPDETKKAVLSARFDAIFCQKTGFATLDGVLKRLHRNKDGLLQVLENPLTPLHTNGSESDIREQVIRKKISGGTRSDLGRQCRDTFLSVKKTCRKLGVSFWRYLLDRTAGTDSIPPLPVLIRQKAEAAA
jgi:hypothetical protein